MIVIYRDYDGPGDQELFRTRSNLAQLLTVGDTIIVKGQDSYVVCGRTFVYDPIEKDFTTIVYYISSKGIASGLRTMQAPPAPRAA